MSPANTKYIAIPCTILNTPPPPLPPKRFVLPNQSFPRKSPPPLPALGERIPTLRRSSLRGVVRTAIQSVLDESGGTRPAAQTQNLDWVHLTSAGKERWDSCPFACNWGQLLDSCDSCWIQLLE